MFVILLFCLSFRSEAEESAFAFACSLPTHPNVWVPHPSQFHRDGWDVQRSPPKPLRLPLLLPLLLRLFVLAVLLSAAKNPRISFAVTSGDGEPP
jgi:hypothetical protein